MNLKKKSLRLGIVFLLLLFTSGLLLMYKGNDAVALAVEKKEGILNAEQVKISFDSVSGRLVNEAVIEAQEVKKGDVLMVLDSTDVDLSLAKMQAQIAQMEAQIRSAQGTIRIGYAQTDTAEQQDFRQIDQQRAAVDSAKESYANKQLDYNRKMALAASGAISQAELDDSQTNLNVAAANAAQQQQLLGKLLAGAIDSGNTEQTSLPSIEQQRETLENKQYDVQNLVEQKRNLEVQLEELKVKKERLLLRAPEDGKILKLLAKQGEMISPNVPVILLESKRNYYDIYLSEKQVVRLAEGDSVMGKAVADGRKVAGTVRLITAAPGFADLKMSREKGQADLASFQVRIYTEVLSGLLPGMTVEVTQDEFIKR
jgi:Multidrug resistance efflux pump